MSLFVDAREFVALLPVRASKAQAMKPRQLLPLQEPSQTLLIYPPILPSNSVEGSLTKSSRLHELYNVSSHIVPAAFPRTSAFVPLPSEAQKALSNEANEKLAKGILETLLDLSFIHMQKSQGGGGRRNSSMTSWRQRNETLQASPTTRMHQRLSPDCFGIH